MEYIPGKRAAVEKYRKSLAVLLHDGPRLWQVTLHLEDEGFVGQRGPFLPEIDELRKLRNTRRSRGAEYEEGER